MTSGESAREDCPELAFNHHYLSDIKALGPDPFLDRRIYLYVETSSLS